MISRRGEMKPRHERMATKNRTEYVTSRNGKIMDPGGVGFPPFLLTSFLAQPSTILLRYSRAMGMQHHNSPASGLFLGEATSYLSPSTLYSVEPPKTTSD